MTDRTLEEVIGANVKALRGEWSMAELGRALAPFVGEDGWSRQTVWKAENGQRQFSPLEIMALAAVLEVTIPQLYETVEPILLPSGRSLPAESVDALASGTNKEAELIYRLQQELRGLDRMRQQLSRLASVQMIQVHRIKRALVGLPEPKIDTTTAKGVLSYFDQLTAQQWTEPRPDGEFPSWEDVEKRDGK